MAPKDFEEQGDIAAIPNTKRGLGLWRGQIVHPADGRLPEIKDAMRRGAESITCAKGLVKLSPVRASVRGATAHFRVNDPDYVAKIESAYPEFHHAAVRVIANYLSAEGYAGLRRLCYRTCLPEAEFTVGAVARERVFKVCGVIYRPDIVVEPVQEGYPRVELEVVNTHGPGEERLKAARAEYALVLWMNIRDLVEKYVSDDRQVLVPDDETLLAALLRLWFTAPLDRESYAAASLARWKDLDQAKYMRHLRESLRDAEAAVAQSLKMARSIAAGESFHLRPTNDENYVYRELMAGVHAAKSGEIDRLLEHYEHATVMPNETREALADLRAAHDGLEADVRVLESLLNIVFRMLQERWLRAGKEEEDRLQEESKRRAAEARAARKREEEEKARKDAERAERARQARAATAARETALLEERRLAEAESCAALTSVADKCSTLLSRLEDAGDIEAYKTAAKKARQDIFDIHWNPLSVVDSYDAVNGCLLRTRYSYIRAMVARLEA